MEKIENTDNAELQEKGLLGTIVGAAFGPIGMIAGSMIEDKIRGTDEEEEKKKQEEEEKKKNDDKKDDKKKQENKKSGGGGGGCSGGAGGAGDGGPSSSDSPSPNADPTAPENLGDVKIPDVDDSVNSMCQKKYTVYRAIPKEYNCPVAQRDNLADQFTPQNDLLTMEKTTRDFLKLESKIYDAETTNPRFFAAEGWVEQYEKDKNVVLSLLDQYRTNIIRMEHLYDMVDNQSYNKLVTIPNQDCKESFQTNILWTSRALKDWSNNWFIKKPMGGGRGGMSSRGGGVDCSTPLFKKDYWLPGLTGQMVQWMKLGSYIEPTQVRAISIETMIERVDKLEGLIDRLMNEAAVNTTISKFLNVKEKLEKKANQKEDKVFTAKVIDSTMGKKLGVTDTGIENHKIEGTKYIPPKTDKVEDYSIVDKLSQVKKLFQQLRDKSLDAMFEGKQVAHAGPGPYPDIWNNIDKLAEPVYKDLNIMNELITDKYNDYENPGKHCSVTRATLDPALLMKNISAFRGVIFDGVLDVIVNQLLLPTEGLNILDSMFNQLWEYGEKGPTIEMPTWCREAIDSINGFERSMLDAWSEVFDCWEREFITRLWSVEVDHHSSNFELEQTRFCKTVNNHFHPYVPFTLLTLASIGGDTRFMLTTPMKGVLTCPGHHHKLMKPVCVQYRVFNIAHLARHYRSDVKSLCQWMVCAIQAIGIKLAAISAVMSDPSLNGNDGNVGQLDTINELRDRNHEILKEVEKAYCAYQDVNNMKNKKEYDEEIALQELQPNKYSNEDQMNMTSSAQSESNQKTLASIIHPANVIQELMPWNHLNLDANKVEPKPIPDKKPNDKFDEVITSAAGFEKLMNMEEYSGKGDDKKKNKEEDKDDVFSSIKEMFTPMKEAMAAAADAAKDAMTKVAEAMKK